MFSDLKAAQIRAPAFKYLIDNINVKYQNFNPAEHPDIAYIPAVNALAGKVSLSRHNQVCLLVLTFIGFDCDPGLLKP